MENKTQVYKGKKTEKDELNKNKERNQNIPMGPEKK